MICRHCGATSSLVKKGSFFRKTGPSPRISRFYCKACRRYSSTQTHTLSAGHRKPELNKLVYLVLASGVSQRRAARLLGTTQKTIARKLVRLGTFAQLHHERDMRQRLASVEVAVFDEMETFEHSKCKPLSLAVAVEEGSRRLLAIAVAQMPAKGHLAAIARKKYGPRADHRRQGLAHVLGQVSRVAIPEGLVVKSDQCPRYPRAVRESLPGVRHVTFKGRRGCVVGQGELKSGGFDPLFALNHSCAMVRDNLKRLSRRTWCTTKRPDRLQCLLNLYICAHNAMIDQKSSTKDALAPGPFLS